MRLGHWVRVIFILIAVLIQTACKPEATPSTGAGIDPEAGSSRTLVVTPAEKTNGTALLIYKQETYVSPAFSQATYLEIPMQIMLNPDSLNKGDHLMEGTKSGEMHMTLAGKGVDYCFLTFIMTVSVTARGSFNAGDCTFSIGQSAVVNEVTDRGGNCPTSPENKFPDQMLLGMFIPPPETSMLLKGATLKDYVTFNKDSTLTLELRDVTLPGVENCQW